MATPKTASFFLTETVVIPAASASGTRVQGTIDLGAYVSVAEGLALAVTSVDFVYQGNAQAAFGDAVGDMIQGNGAFSAQLTDLNPGTAFIRADNNSLIASGAMNIDQSNNIATFVNDLYPDNFGSASLSEAFLIVSDSIFLVCGVQSAASSAADDIAITARIRCQIVKLSTKDWMAIAIQSTASDN